MAGAQGAGLFEGHAGQSASTWGCGQTQCPRQGCSSRAVGGKARPWHLVYRFVS